MTRLDRAVTIADLQRLARRRLPSPVLDIVEGGAGEEWSVAANRAAFAAVELLPRSLKDTRSVSLETTVLGTAMSLPVLLAPCSFGRICHPGGEAAVARAAKTMGATYVMPGAASAASPESVAAAGAGDLWYQLYVGADEATTTRTVQRVANAGYRALCVTIDTPGRPLRERDLRNRLAIPVRPTPRLLASAIAKPGWLAGFVAGAPWSGLPAGSARHDYQAFAGMMADLRPVGAAEISAIRAAWDGPLLLKGVLRAEDIDEMVELGVDGVVVSNHGGRNLDTSVPTLQVLPDIVGAAAGRLAVLLDSGVRRGTDVVKALALGADAVMVGRPYLYGLAAGGERGVARALEIIKTELRVAMSFLGVERVADLDTGFVRRAV